MLQRTYAVLLLAVLAAPVAHAQDQQKPNAKTAHEVHDRLSLAVSVEGFEPNTPLRDALGHYADRFGLTILIDTQAFKDDLQINEPEQQPVKLSRMINVPLCEIMRLLCEQGQGAIAQTGNVIWVVPKERVLPRLLKQEVDVTFDKRPLDEALKQLADQSGFSIVLDELRSGDAARTPVTARLRGVGLENAVRILADQAELKAILVDKVLYVTTPPNAEAWREEMERRLPVQPKSPQDAGKEEKPEKATSKKEVKPKAK